MKGNFQVRNVGITGWGVKGTEAEVEALHINSKQSVWVAFIEKLRHWVVSAVLSETQAQGVALN